MFLLLTNLDVTLHRGFVDLVPICSGGESLIVRASPARSLYKCDAYATCALCVQCSTTLVTISRCVLVLLTWLCASLSEHLCGVEEENAIAEQFATQAASGSATNDAAALRADGRSLSALPPLSGDWRRGWLAATACTRGSHSACCFSRLLCASVLNTVPVVYEYCMMYLIARKANTCLILATSSWVLYWCVIILYSFFVCSWLPLVDSAGTGRMFRTRSTRALSACASSAQSRAGDRSREMNGAPRLRQTTSGSSPVRPTRHSPLTPPPSCSLFTAPMLLHIVHCSMLVFVDWTRLMPYACELGFMYCLSHRSDTSW